MRCRRCCRCRIAARSPARRPCARTRRAPRIRRPHARGANGSVSSNSSSTSVAASSGSSATSTSLVAVRVERVELGLARAPAAARCAARTGHVESARGSAGTPAAPRPSRSIASAGRPPRIGGPCDASRRSAPDRRPAPGRRPAVRQRRGVDTSRETDAALAGQPEGVERASAAVTGHRRRSRRRLAVPDAPVRPRAAERKRGIIARFAASCQKMSDKNNERTALAPAGAGARRPATARALLDRLGLPFVVAAPGVDEAAAAGRSAGRDALRLAEAKARAVARAASRTRWSSAPTRSPTATGAHVGKPGTHERAVAQLRALSGRTVVFHTGVALLDAASGRCQRELVDVASTFRALSRARDRRLPRPRGALRLRRVGASPKGSASRCSSASKATIRRALDRAAADRACRLLRARRRRRARAATAR